MPYQHNKTGHQHPQDQEARQGTIPFSSTCSRACRKPCCVQHPCLQLPPHPPVCTAARQVAGLQHDCSVASGCRRGPVAAHTAHTQDDVATLGEFGCRDIKTRQGTMDQPAVTGSIRPAWDTTLMQCSEAFSKACTRNKQRHVLAPACQCSLQVALVKPVATAQHACRTWPQRTITTQLASQLQGQASCTAHLRLCTG